MKLVWLAVAIAFAIGEMMTATVTLIWFSIAALILIFLSSVIESIVLQIVIFGIISTVLLVVATKRFIKDNNVKSKDTNLQAVIDKKALVKKEIPVGGNGLVVIMGEEWTAISPHEEVIEKDEYVRVIQIEGVKLVVEKYN